MTVQELVELLQQYDEDLPVRCMVQPNYPFECQVHSVIERDEMDDECGTEQPNAVFVVVGSQVAYGSRAAWGD